MYDLPRLEIADRCSPFDEAVLTIGGREEETITIECENALDLADRLIRYVNAQPRVLMSLTVASEVLRRFGAEAAAAEIDDLYKTIGEAA